MNVRRVLAAATAIAALSAAPSAHAQVGFTFAGRVGASLPFGDAFRTATGTPVPVAENSTGSIPLQLDVGVTQARQTFVGACGPYRFGQYSQASTTVDGARSAFPIPERTLHSWFEMGLGTTFDL